MSQVKQLAPGWRCPCGRCWSPFVLACPVCANDPEAMKRYGWREVEKRVARMNKTLERAGV